MSSPMHTGAFPAMAVVIAVTMMAYALYATVFVNAKVVAVTGLAVFNPNE